MSFVEIQFPPSISMGAVGGPRFSTSVLILNSGFEQRNINWAKSRGEWDVSQGLKTEVDIENLLAFYYARQGRAYGFRFKDWSDYQVPRWDNTPGDLAGFGDEFAIPVWFTTDGATTTFQLTKTYSDGVVSFVRLIQKPVVGTLQLLDNGTQIFSPGDFTVDTTTGIVTLSGAIAATTGHLIAGSVEFDVPCRFDTDDMKITTTMVDNFSWSPIPIVEIRDIT